ncbi:hypothetical protein [Variovorax sp. DAIF25]|uniref:hypothetical protein n=1 Tax=Variovorax sp. DAIF25 TaxID=3080983 RepID=UPI003D6A1017
MTNQTPNTPSATGRCDGKREDFLLETYRQTSTHLGRHITGLWQCVGVVGAALIVFAQDKDKPLNDYSCTLVVMLCGWLAATTLDASNWFNRNLAIITNVERLFLNSDDLKLVHPFFGSHRPPGKYAQHFEIQFWLSGAVGALVLCYHFIERVVPGFSLPLANFQLARALPYLLAPVVLFALVRLHRHYVKKDEEFQQKSPGIVL